MEIATILEGRIVKWKPLHGLSASIDERTLRLGAVTYGFAILGGKPEAEAHQEAEKVIFKTLYRVQY